LAVGGGRGGELGSEEGGDNDGWLGEW